MQNFYEGVQYPDGYLEDIPKFVANLCKNLINTKASKIRGTPYSIAYQSVNNKATTLLEKFDRFTLTCLHYDVGLQQSIINMLIYGTEIVLYRFDDSKVITNAVYKGNLVREHIDLRRFAVANNFLPSIQKQKWVMYRNYEEVDAIRSRCKKMVGETDEEFEERKASIVPDDYNPEDNTDPTLISHGVCMVYTRYFRKNGEVYFQSSTKNVDLFDPISLNPHTNAKIIKSLKKSLEESEEKNNDINKIADYDIDSQNVNIEASKDKMSDDEYQEEMSKFTEYPFADFSQNRRFNHFYGISDIQDVISAQQVVNFCLTMAGKDVQENAWGKWLVKEGALRGQKINNDGGQVIIDYSRNGQGFGIQRVETNRGNAINIVNYAQSMIETIRNLSGVNEAISGQNASQLSGYAISLLQEQGNTVFEMIQSQLWNDFAVNEARIRLLFYINYFDDKVKFVYEKSDLEYEKDVLARNEKMQFDIANYQANPTQVPQPNYDNYPKPNRVEELTFESGEARKIRYYIVPKAGRGIKYSEVVQADLINQLFKDGTIANLSITDKRAYIELNPMIDETTKSKFKEILEQQEHSENARLNQQNQQLNQAVQQQTAVIEQLKGQLRLYEQYVTDLKKGFSESLGAARKSNQYKTDAINQMIKNQEKQEQSTYQNSEETQNILDEGLNAAIGK